MQCKDLQQLLENSKGQGLALSASGQQHLRECEVCAEFAEDVEFANLWQGNPVPPASIGFTDRALQQAWLQRESSDTREGSSRMRTFAIAACLVLATSVALQSLWPEREAGIPDSSRQVVQVTPQSVNSINLLMVSQVDLPEATITLRMDDNVVLAGYAGNQELRWPTSLLAGNNQLTLPVQLQGNDSGNILVVVESNGARKQMSLVVDAAQPQQATTLVI